MKVSNLRLWAWVIIALVTILGLVCGVKSSWGFSSDKLFGNDLRWRRNEILCAHQGVNSFRIWNREITLDGFAPIGRIDFPNVEIKPGDKFVHAYPPWHICFFYFYGWLPEILCISLMSILFGICIKYIFDEVVKISNKITPFGNIVAGFVLSMIIFPMVQCFMVLNYGILIATLLLLLRKFINSDNQICAGLCWALMMIKPQVGILFFWPLFWQKKYKTIIIAVLVCLCATCFTAFIVNENPISLILQIPEIGKPYNDGLYIVNAFLKPIFGSSAIWFYSGGLFMLSALLSLWTKDANDFLVSSVPIVVLIPLWTYSQSHDAIIQIPWILLLVICAHTMKVWQFYLILTLFDKILHYVTLTMISFSLSVPGLSRINFVHHLFLYRYLPILAIFASILFAWQLYQQKIPYRYLEK